MVNFCSDLSSININYYLKLRIPKMHRQFFKKISQNPEHVKQICNDKTNPFHFAIRERTNTSMSDDGMIELYLIKGNLSEYVNVNKYEYYYTCTNKYNYTYSNTNNNIIILIIVQILFFSTFFRIK